MEHGSIITQDITQDDAPELTKQSAVSKSSPKRPRGRNIFKAPSMLASAAPPLSPPPTSRKPTPLLSRLFSIPVYQIPGICLALEATEDQGRKCVVTDLEETLAHSSFKPTTNACRDGGAGSPGARDPWPSWMSSRDDWGRPWDVFSSGQAGQGRRRCDRRACGTAVGCSGRQSYTFHPENAVPGPPWFDSMTGTELLTLTRICEGLRGADDDYTRLGQPQGPCSFPAKASPAGASATAA
nr:carboxy-terminal domain RNA polymerase II polypeptide A small phosphatase 2-like [Oryctolagus cuniculus]